MFIEKNFTFIDFENEHISIIISKLLPELEKSYVSLKTNDPKFSEFIVLLSIIKVMITKSMTFIRDYWIDSELTIYKVYSFNIFDSLSIDNGINSTLKLYFMYSLLILNLNFSKLSDFTDNLKNHILTSSLFTELNNGIISQLEEKILIPDSQKDEYCKSGSNPKSTSSNNYKDPISYDLKIFLNHFMGNR